MDLWASILFVSVANALVLFLWHGALIGLVWAVAARALRGAPPQARYLVGCAAMLAMVIAAGAGLWISFVEARAEALLFEARGRVTQGEGISISIHGALALLWAAGVLFMAARLLVGWAGLRGLVAKSSPVPAALEETVARVARALEVRVAVRIAASAEVLGPVVIGSLRPTILVPIALLSGAPLSVIEPLIAHELAHIRRFDFLVNVLQSITETLLFYHPAVWWVSRAVRREREYCCDDLAVKVTGDPIVYARALVEVEALRPRAVPLGMAASGGPLMNRIRRLVLFVDDPSRGAARALSARSLAAVMAVAGAALLPVLPSCGQPAEPPAAQGQSELSAEGEIKIAWLPGSIAPFKTELEVAAKRHGVDPDLLAIVALVESNGNPSAESPLGALGLMQIMPKTGAKIAEERGIKEHSTEKLRDPKYNIDFAAWLVKRHLEEFSAAAPEEDQAIELAAAAYNAGPKRVRAFLEKGEPLSEESARYKAIVAGMWKERGAPASATYESLRRPK
ncbi:MAG: transglycosylase SLT domain-containing protein [Polyangiaceae bacterium]|nr:transglycosylase SLT domain-containing protein [Polyangiaceae bacterium]